MTKLIALCLVGAAIFVFGMGIVPLPKFRSGPPPAPPQPKNLWEAVKFTFSPPPVKTPEPTVFERCTASAKQFLKTETGGWVLFTAALVAAVFVIAKAANP